MMIVACFVALMLSGCGSFHWADRYDECGRDKFADDDDDSFLGSLFQTLLCDDDDRECHRR